MKLTSSLPVVLCSLVLCGAAARADIVLNQIYAPSTYGTGGASSPGHTSQNYTDTATVYQNATTVVVDDFTVTGSTLDLTNISAVIDGFGTTFKSFANVTGWEVAIYSSLNAAHTSVTGDVFDGTVAPSAATVGTTKYDTASSDNNVLLSLPVNIVLPAAGTYYLGVMGVNSILSNGQIAVYAKGTAGSANAWQMAPKATSIFGDPTKTALGNDAAYEIIGGPAAVPEPATWATLAAGGLAAAFLALRRRAARA